MIYTKDLYDRLEELESYAQGIVEGREEGEDVSALEELFGDGREELEQLRALSKEIGGGFGDESMIPAVDWVDYVKDMLEDSGIIPNDLESFVVIDWEATAKNVAVDYVEVSWQGRDYYVLAY